MSVTGSWISWVGDLHATPQSPKPELKTTDPLWMSATASSALFHSFAPPRLAVTGAACDLHPAEFEKLRAQTRRGLLSVEAAVVAPVLVNLASVPLAHSCREDAWRATAAPAVVLDIRTIPAMILALVVSWPPASCRFSVLRWSLRFPDPKEKSYRFTHLMKRRPETADEIRETAPFPTFLLLFRRSTRRLPAPPSRQQAPGGGGSNSRRRFLFCPPPIGAKTPS